MSTYDQLKSLIEKTVSDELELRRYVKSFRIQNNQKLHSLLVETCKLDSPEMKKHNVNFKTFFDVNFKTFVKVEKDLNQKVIQILQQTLIDKEKIASHLKELSIEQTKSLLKFWSEEVIKIDQIEKA